MEKHKKSQDIKISDLLKEGAICLDLKGNTKREVIYELAKLLKLARLNNTKEFLKAIIERENLGSTAIGNGIAIPHAKLKELRRFILAFARKNKGVDFGALDGGKTYLFFILASPKETSSGHLKILAELARLTKDKLIVELLKKAVNEKEILRVLQSDASPVISEWA